MVQGIKKWNYICHCFNNTIALYIFTIYSPSILSLIIRLYTCVLSMGDST